MGIGEESAEMRDTKLRYKDKGGGRQVWEEGRDNHLR